MRGRASGPSTGPTRRPSRVAPSRVAPPHVAPPRVVPPRVAPPRPRPHGALGASATRCRRSRSRTGARDDARALHRGDRHPRCAPGRRSSRRSGIVHQTHEPVCGTWISTLRRRFAPQRLVNWCLIPFGPATRSLHQGWGHGARARGRDADGGRSFACRLSPLPLLPQRAPVQPNAWARSARSFDRATLQPCCLRRAHADQGLSENPDRQVRRELEAHRKRLRRLKTAHPAFSMWAAPPLLAKGASARSPLDRPAEGTRAGLAALPAGPGGARVWAGAASAGKAPHVSNVGLRVRGVYRPARRAAVGVMVAGKPCRGAAAQAGANRELGARVRRFADRRRAPG